MFWIFLNFERVFILNKSHLVTKLMSRRDLFSVNTPETYYLYKMQLLKKCKRRQASIIPVSILNKSHLVTSVKMRLIQCKNSRNILFQMQLLNKCNRRRASIIPVSILNKSHLVTNVKMRLIQCKNSRNILYKMQLLNKCNRRRASIIPVSILNKCHLVTIILLSRWDLFSVKTLKTFLICSCWMSVTMYLFSYLKNWDVCMTV